MTGDLADFVYRLKATLPRRWFGDDIPVLTQILQGPAAALSQCYTIIQAVRRQVRIHLADGDSLDSLTKDYLGSRTTRRIGESDGSLRQRVMRDLVRDRASRRSLVDALKDITGRQAVVFEPANPRDTGGYGRSGSTVPYGVGYNLSGRWGNLHHPNQCFVTAFRPIGVGSAPGRGWGGGGYNTGHNAYADLTILRGLVSDEDIRSTIRDVIPAGTVVWLKILS